MNWQKYAIPFTGGLDTKTDENILLPTQLADLKNGQFTKHGLIQMRPGHSATGNVAVPGTAINGTTNTQLFGDKVGVFTRGDELCLATDERVYSHDSNLNKWIMRSRYYPITHTLEEVANVNANQAHVGVATTDSIRVVVWEDSRGGIRYSVYSAATGAAYTQDIVLASSNVSRPYAVPLGNNVMITYADHSTDAIKGLLIYGSNTVANLGGTPISLVGDLESTRLYTVTTDDSYMYFIYESDASVVAAGVAAAAVNALGTTSWKVNVSADTPTTLDIRYQVGFLGMIWYGGTDVSTTTTNASTGTTTAVVDVTVANVESVAMGARYGLAQWSYAYTVSGASNDLNIVYVTRPDFGSAFAIRHSYLVSSGFEIGSRGGFILGHESRSGLQNAYYLYTDEGYLFGQLHYQTAIDQPSVYYPAKVWNNTEVAVGFNRKLEVDDTTSGIFTHTGVSIVTLDHTPKLSFADVDGTSYLSGSMLWAFDGQGCAEANLLMFPDMNTADLVVSNGTGSLDVSSQYSYRVYYVIHRPNGERVRSAAITRSATTGASDDTITLTIPTLAFTRWHKDHITTCDEDKVDVSIEVYRTIGNDTSGLFYRCSGDDPATVSGANRYIYNDTTANTVSFQDDMADDTLTTKEVDYLSVGEIEHIPPPGPTVIRAIGPRLYLAGGAIKTHQIWYSKLRFPGEPAEFSDILVIDDLPSYNGPVTEISHVNQALCVFKERGIVAVSGDGYDNTGSSGGYLSQLVTADLGCAGASVVVPTGIMFASSDNKGIYHLDQSFDQQYIGAPVEAYNSQTFANALVIPGTNQVLFLAESGSSVVYDYLFQQWSTWTNLGTSAAVWQSTYAVLSSADKVLYRDTSTYQDDNTAYAFQFRTGAIRVDDNLQSYARIRLFEVLGNYISAHKLRVNVYYDRELTPYETFLWDPSTVIDTSDVWGAGATWGSGSYWGGSRNGRTYQFVHRLKRQKFSTLRFEFIATSNTTGAAFELSELTCQIGVKQGLQKHAATRKY